MKTETHMIQGCSLQRIEELDHLGTPDWVPYTVTASSHPSALEEAMTNTLHFSGLCRQLCNSEYIMDGKMHDEEGVDHDICDVLDDAAERLDQAHQEWLEAKLANSKLLDAVLIQIEINPKGTVPALGYAAAAANRKDPAEPQPSITILWGENPEPDDEPVTYTFNTKAELAAFCDGIEAADGWLAYEVIA